MKRLNTLWLTMVIGCFLNLLIGLAHWSKLAAGPQFAYLNLIISIAMIILVIVSTFQTRHLPTRLRDRFILTYVVAIFIAILTEWH